MLSLENRLSIKPFYKYNEISLRSMSKHFKNYTTLIICSTPVTLKSVPVGL